MLVFSACVGRAAVLGGDDVLVLVVRKVRLGKEGGGVETHVDHGLDGVRYPLGELRRADCCPAVGMKRDSSLEVRLWAVVGPLRDTERRRVSKLSLHIYAARPRTCIFISKGNKSGAQVYV